MLADEFQQRAWLPVPFPPTPRTVLTLVLSLTGSTAKARASQPSRPRPRPSPRSSPYSSRLLSSRSFEPLVCSQPHFARLPSPFLRSPVSVPSQRSHSSTFAPLGGPSAPWLAQACSSPPTRPSIVSLTSLSRNYGHSRALWETTNTRAESNYKTTQTRDSVCERRERDEGTDRTATHACTRPSSSR